MNRLRIYVIPAIVAFIVAALTTAVNHQAQWGGTSYVAANQVIMVDSGGCPTGYKVIFCKKQ